jgi:hypothetical protein
MVMPAPVPPLSHANAASFAAVGKTRRRRMLMWDQRRRSGGKREFKVSRLQGGEGYALYHIAVYRDVRKMSMKKAFEGLIPREATNLISDVHGRWW